MKGSQGIPITRRKFIGGSFSAFLGGFLLEGVCFPPRAKANTPAAGAWPYTRLDPDTIGRAAWSPPDCEGCGGKSFGAIVYGLRSAFGPGSPWDQLPVNMGMFGNGGGPRRETCGAVITPYLLMNLVGAGRAIGRQFYQWYCDFAFPSTDWDNYVPPSGPLPSKNLVRTVSKSTLCSISRDKWQKEYYRVYGESAKEPHNDRCTKLICDCTKKAVELLNDWEAGALPVGGGGNQGRGALDKIHER